MRFVKIFLTIFIIILVLGIIFGTVYVKTISKRGLPDYNANIELTGIQEEVVVYRDSFAIPHIYAQNEHDVYYTTGYLLAQDRLWQMDLLRRVTLGRLSEIFGKDFIETDWLLQALKYSEKSEILLDSLDKPLRLALEAFSEGVNQYITNHWNDLPVEFTLLKYKPEKWKPLHSLNLICYMAWDLKSGWCNLVLDEIKQKVDEERFHQIIPGLSDYEPVVFPDYGEDSLESSSITCINDALAPLRNLGLEVFSASNNWAVSGDKSVTGKPLFANDMHLGYNVPGIWYQIHQVVKDSLHVTGVLLPGQPFIIVGHNERIAWGMTNTYVDNLDFYEEEVHTEDSSKYKFNGEWRNMKTGTIEIITKEKDTIQKTVRYTHRGPVISDIKPSSGKVFSMRWMGAEFSNEIETIYKLNRAKNWSDFVHAVKTFKAISQNINYADVDGNIGIYCCAGVPVRKRNAGLTFLPGDTDEYDWTGLVPFEKLPYSYNPPSGYVASANNKTTDNTYPYHIGTWYSLPYRMNRVKELLENMNPFSISDFKAMQSDHHSKMVSEMLPEVLRVLEYVNDLKELEVQALHLMQNWNGNLTKESKAALVFESMYLALVENLFQDELGKELYEKYLTIASIARLSIDEIFVKKTSPWCDDITTEKTETLQDMIELSFTDAVSDISSIQGTDTSQWEWGKVHQITLEHPLGSVNALQKAFRLNKGPYPAGGSYHTLCPYSYLFSHPFAVHHGASQRHIYNVGNWDNSYTVIPTGISGIPSSPHYCDQTEIYLNGKYHRDHFSREKVEENALYKMMIIGE